MKIGEIVETLIRIRDWHTLNETEREALAEACNLLDRLPRLENAIEFEETLEIVMKTVYAEYHHLQMLKKDSKGK